MEDGLIARNLGCSPGTMCVPVLARRRDCLTGRVVGSDRPGPHQPPRRVPLSRRRTPRWRQQGGGRVPRAAWAGGDHDATRRHPVQLHPAARGGLRIERPDAQRAAALRRLPPRAAQTQLPLPGNTLTTRHTRDTLADVIVLLHQLEGWWTYEYCRGRWVQQFHQEGDERVAAFTLGLAPLEDPDVRHRWPLLRLFFHFFWDRERRW